MLKDFLWKRFKLKYKWFKIRIDIKFLDFSGCYVVGYNLKHEVIRWLNENVDRWSLWDCEGDIYGIKFINETDAVGFKLMYGEV